MLTLWSFHIVIFPERISDCYSELLYLLECRFASRRIPYSANEAVWASQTEYHRVSAGAKVKACFEDMFPWLSYSEVLFSARTVAKSVLRNVVVVDGRCKVGDAKMRKHEGIFDFVMALDCSTS